MEKPVRVLYNILFTQDSKASFVSCNPRADAMSDSSSNKRSYHFVSIVGGLARGSCVLEFSMAGAALGKLPEVGNLASCCGDGSTGAM